MKRNVVNTYYLQRFLGLTLENAINWGQCAAHNTLVMWVQRIGRQSSLALTAFPVVTFVPMETDPSCTLLSLFLSLKKRLQKQWPGGNMKYSYSHYLEVLTNIQVCVCFYRLCTQNHMTPIYVCVYIFIYV